MKIYIASSWKNENTVKYVSSRLREAGHEVDCFADNSTGRYVFHFSEIGDRESLNAVNFLADERSQRAFLEDKKWLDWCDCVVMVLPAGKSTHLEAGYAKGCGKKLYIFGQFPYGEFDVMYGFADKLIPNDNLSCLVEELGLKARVAVMRVSPYQFLKLPVEERRKFLAEQASDTEIIKYYQDVWADECATQDLGMCE